MPLLPLLRAQAGQSTASMAIMAATVICIVWALGLLSGVDLKPAISSLYQATEPYRQEAHEIYRGLTSID